MSEMPSPLSEEAQLAHDVLRDILRHMAFPAAVEVTEDAEQIVLTMTSEQSMGVLIGKGGQTLNAIELLVRTIAQTRLHTLDKHIVVDAEGYRERHAEQLREIARQAAQQVLDTEEPVPLEPMTPRDRRTVHMAIAEIDGVVSASAGVEPYRHVLVCLPGQYKESDEG